MKRTILIAVVLLSLFLTARSQSRIESLKIVWPEEYKWKVGNNQEDATVHMMELVPGNETVDKWTLMGNMLSIKGAKNVPMDVAMNTMFQQAQQNAPKAKLTLIEKDEKAAHPWVLFKIEAPGFKDDKRPESQLYYIIQGDSSLYSNFIAMKVKELPADFVEKWSKVFKDSELVYLQ